MAAKQFFLPYATATINAVAEPGAQLAFYTSGTTTKLPVYATSALTTQLSNPVVANGAGRFPDIYLDDALTYRMKVLDRSGAQLDDIDPFVPGDLLFTVNTNAITPQLYAEAAGLGTLGLGVQDDSAAFVLAIAALEAEALNNGSIYYNGSRSLFIPAGHYYMGTTALDIRHTLAIQGEGSGQFGPGSYGCTRLRWADGSDGIRIQAANTSGNTTIDSPIHDGAGGVTINDICLQGGFNGTTESDHHGLVIRNAIKATNLYIKNWPGEGVKAWAGNVTGQPAVSGNVSTTMLTGVKTEGCRGGIDIRGSDSNVVTTINCEGYQNRLFGLLDDNGAGSNTHIGVHCASNGVVFGTWAQTQCSYSGNYYALKWGGDPTVAPSGTTADTANWYYIVVGAPFAGLIPAWVNTPNTFRAGGDYLTLNSAGVLMLNCYSETGGFSQFNNNTKMECCTLTSQYFRGGVQLEPSGLGDGTQSKVWGNNHHYMDFSGTEAGIIIRDLVTQTILSYATFERGSNSWFFGSGANLVAGVLAFGGTTAIDASRNATLASAALGGGTALTKTVVYTPSITPASVAAATVAEQTFTVTGLTTADKVTVNPPAIANSTGVAGARVSAADTLAIRFTNPTAGALTPTAGTYTVLAFRS